MMYEPSVRKQHVIVLATYSIRNTGKGNFGIVGIYRLGLTESDYNVASL